MTVYDKIQVMKVMFIESRVFSRDRANLLPDDLFQQFEEYLLEFPEAGDLIVGTGGCRKIRWQRQGTGKSGGVRVIYYFRSASNRIYLLFIYSKNQQDNLSDAQKTILRDMTQHLE